MTPALFGENASGWTDMSNHLVHFTKDYGGRDAYRNMLGILSGGVIRARNAFGICRKTAPDPQSQLATCLSEVPLHQLGRLSAKRSEHGIVFRKDFVIGRGGNPILYAYKDRAVAKAIKKLAQQAGNDAENPIWRVTPFVDVPGSYGTSQYFFEWEREWRVVGDFAFTPDDVVFLIIPENLHAAARSFVDDARTENLGPAYDCPFIDAHWDLETIQPLLANA
ncbi:abortive infection system antitoxin AbiGi family protein [Oceanibaculum pacificum]|jgi:hypothetical protein|uniref:Uncharacterized protein n=1 Tax=Oceanibaculum pacificum TaxID=580166 RepID=A0A154W1L6_9PROT|nr:abortive infection system antitoxin AbiGi family protein [Oceanibaculum pacificum]KZD07347.1 hypothetical protein AUP43_02165 [Oceanibaculum pacificum]